MQEKRIKLFNKFRDAAINVSDFDKKYKDFSAWENINFKDDTSVQEIWNKSLKGKDKDGNVLWGDTLKSFYSTFACDLDWAKSTKYCGGTPVIPPTPDPDEKKKTNDPDKNKITPPVKSGCPATRATEDDVKNGKEFIKNCVQGDIVTKIQKHLKKHGFHDISKTGNPDGIFGSRTEGSIQAFQREKKLVVDGVVGPKTWAELVKDKSSSTTTITPVVPVKKTKLDDILAVDDITYDL